MDDRAGAAALLDLLHALVDLQIGPLPRMDVRAFDVGRNPRERDVDTRRLVEVERSLVGRLLEIHPLQRRRPAHDRAADAHRRVNRRRDDRDEITRRMIGGIEHIAVHAEVLDLQARRQSDGPEPHRRVRGVRSGPGVLRERPPRYDDGEDRHHENPDPDDRATGADGGRTARARQTGRHGRHGRA